MFQADSDRLKICARNQSSYGLRNQTAVSLVESGNLHRFKTDAGIVANASERSRPCGAQMGIGCDGTCRTNLGKKTLDRILTGSERSEIGATGEFQVIVSAA